MKLILTSPDAIYNFTTNSYFPGIEKSLDKFLEENDDSTIATISIHSDSLKVIHKRYRPLEIDSKLRGSIELISKIKAALKINFEDIIILAGTSHDFYQAFNSKLLLLNAKYSIINNPKDKFLNGDFGISITNAQGLSLFFEKLCNINDPWYYTLSVSDNTVIYSLINANTMAATKDMKVLSNMFQECLKEGKSQYIMPIRNYFLVSLYRIFKHVQTVDYWAAYPSSTGEDNEELNYFISTARIASKNRIKIPMFIRHTKSIKRHKVWTANQRILDGCASQLATISLNPYYENKLEGKTVAVIDDFTTYGTSCETARALLTSAGVKQLLFITLGRFGKTYHTYEYKISGNVFKSFKFEQLKKSNLEGSFNGFSNNELLNSIRDLI